LGSHGFVKQLRCEQSYRRGRRALEFTSHVPWDSAQRERLHVPPNPGE